MYTVHVCVHACIGDEGTRWEANLSGVIMETSGNSCYTIIQSMVDQMESLHPTCKIDNSEQLWSFNDVVLLGELLK